MWGVLSVSVSCVCVPTAVLGAVMRQKMLTKSQSVVDRSSSALCTRAPHFWVVPLCVVAGSSRLPPSASPQPAAERVSHTLTLTRQPPRLVCVRP